MIVNNEAPEVQKIKVCHMCGVPKIFPTMFQIKEHENGFKQEKYCYECIGNYYMKHKVDEQDVDLHMMVVKNEDHLLNTLERLGGDISELEKTKESRIKQVFDKQKHLISENASLSKMKDISETYRNWMFNKAGVRRPEGPLKC